MVGRLGRYRVLGQLANGGMGSVFVAQMCGPAAFSRLVAIKCLHTRWLGDSEYVARFTTEVKLSALIRHPNVVQTLDVVEESGELFLVMDYVDGVTLAALLADLRRADVPLPVGIALPILSAALRGLHAAHAATDGAGAPLHIVHRDVSPQNIMLGRNGHVQLLDFGAAKAVDQAQHTAVGNLVGRLAYMSPEQLRGEALRPSSDVFSAGVVLWEALVGRRLFHNPSGDRGDRLSGQATALRPSQLRSDIPAAVDDVVDKALQSNAERRFQTALEFAVALESICPAPSAADLARLISEHCPQRLAKNDVWLRSSRAEAAEDAATPIRPALPSAPPPSCAGVALAAVPRPTRHSHVVVLAAMLLGASLIWGTLAAEQASDVAEPPALFDDAKAVTLAAREDGLSQLHASAQPDVAAPRTAAVASAHGSLVERGTTSFATAAKPARGRQRARVWTKPPSDTGAAQFERAARDCDTPTYVDLTGIRHFKKDCM